ncbi:MAG: hypothetical protein ABEI98_09245 [Halorhabdus sp.]
MSADTTADVEKLVERAEDDPSSVSIEEVRPYFEAEDEFTRKRAIDICQAIAYVEPERVVPLVPDLVAFAEDDFLAIKHAALGAISHIVQDEPDAVLDGIDTVAQSLDGETPLTRFLAAKSFGLLVAERPERVAEHLDALFAALAREGPEVPEEIEQSTFGAPDEHEPVREEIGRNISQNENARQLAAKTIGAIVKDDPDAIVPYLEEVPTYVDDRDPIVSGAFVEIVSDLAAADYDLPDETAERVEATLPDGSTQLRARSLRALGYLSATDAVETIQDVAEDTDDDELEAFAEDTAEFLQSTAGE